MKKFNWVKLTENMINVSIVLSILVFLLHIFLYGTDYYWVVYADAGTALGLLFSSHLILSHEARKEVRRRN